MVLKKLCIDMFYDNVYLDAAEVTFTVTFFSCLLLQLVYVEERSKKLLSN